MTAHLMFVEDTIENEIAQGLNQHQIAMTYALALQSSWKTNWSRVNTAITNRWPKGLERIKKMAWSGSCFKDTTL
jgi:hypothetical protein